MKKKTPRKLVLPRDIVRQLQVPELEDIAGGATVTCNCDSCGNRHSTCPV
jgi:hypothetical protein